jgi:hypothetical protein
VDDEVANVVARDRGGYALAAQEALPRRFLVADRWPLVKNASRAFLDALWKINAQVGAATMRRRSFPEFSPRQRSSIMRDIYGRRKERRHPGNGQRGSDNQGYRPLYGLQSGLAHKVLPRKSGFRSDVPGQRILCGTKCPSNRRPRMQIDTNRVPEAHLADEPIPDPCLSPMGRSIVRETARQISQKLEALCRHDDPRRSFEAIASAAVTRHAPRQRACIRCV